MEPSSNPSSLFWWPERDRGMPSSLPIQIAAMQNLQDWSLEATDCINLSKSSRNMGCFSVMSDRSSCKFWWHCCWVVAVGKDWSHCLTWASRSPCSVVDSLGWKCSVGIQSESVDKASPMLPRGSHEFCWRWYCFLSSLVDNHWPLLIHAILHHSRFSLALFDSFSGGASHLGMVLTRTIPHHTQSLWTVFCGIQLHLFLEAATVYSALQ